jgi:hypothetical protein
VTFQLVLEIGCGVKMTLVTVTNGKEVASVERRNDWSSGKSSEGLEAYRRKWREIEPRSAGGIKPLRG